ncbi:hypothetical protein [Microbulbifer sp. M83]|uniref:hypothetical protein n=1 Tax=Microbulbifer sp. M83 TaxID=3118246 RepID=UPI002FE26A98
MAKTDGTSNLAVDLTSGQDYFIHGKLAKAGQQLVVRYLVDACGSELAEVVNKKEKAASDKYGALTFQSAQHIQKNSGCI